MSTRSLGPLYLLQSFFSHTLTPAIFQVYREQLVPAIVDDVIVEFCQKSFPHTATVASLDCTSRALNAIMPSPVADEVIYKVRKVDSNAADTLLRLKTVTSTVSRPCKYGDPVVKNVCRRSRTAVAKRILQLSDKTVKKKVEFLQSCEYLGLSADESDTFSGSAPLAASLQGCSADFGWLNTMVGQIDVAGDKDGKGLHDACKKLVDAFEDTSDVKSTISLWKKIKSTCFDGASAMRSTAQYAGLDSKPDGSSMHACMKKSINTLLPNQHGLCHATNLGFKDAVKTESSWVDMWLWHVKATFNWFSKSPGRKNALKKLHETISVLREKVTWRMVYPKYYCPTRWLGMHRALGAIVGVWPLLQEYAADLVTNGYRPDRRRGEDELNIEERANARLEEEEEAEECSERVNEQQFHVWKNESWDLCVEDTIEGILLPDEELRELEPTTLGTENVPGVDEWSDMDDGVKGKRSKLLDEVTGITALNHGLNCAMLDLLGPYRTLMCRLQTQSHPIAHLVCRWFHEFFDATNINFLGGHPLFGPHFNKWLSDTPNVELKGQVKLMSSRFAHVLLESIKYRLQPYWGLRPSDGV